MRRARRWLKYGAGVPRDVAIVGAGNVHYSDLLRVLLSTLDQNSSHSGKRGGASAGVHQCRQTDGGQAHPDSAEARGAGVQPRSG